MVRPGRLMLGPRGCDATRLCLCGRLPIGVPLCRQPFRGLSVGASIDQYAHNVSSSLHASKWYLVGPRAGSEEAAIDGHRNPSHVRRRLGCEKCCNGSHLIGGAVTRHRDRPGVLVSEFR